MKNPPYSNSMDLANYPSDGDSEDRGGDHREIQNNGTQGSNSYVMGAPSGNKFPPIPDPHDPSYMRDDADNPQGDYGLNERVEVGMKGNAQSQYGFTGSAGGGNKKNMGD